MGRIRYYLIRITNISFKNMFKIIKKISSETKRNKFIIFVDMIWCSLRYQAGYMDYHEFEFYLLSGKQRKTYITGGINNSIIKKYNDKAHWYKLRDKAIFNLIFKKFVKREWIDLKESSIAEFKEFLKNKKQVIVKPVDEYAGKGIEVINVSDNIEELYQTLKQNDQCLVEELIIQHEEMSKLYPKSINSLRIITFNNKNDVNVLQTVLKIGNGGFIDNFAAGGMYTFVDEKGIVSSPAFDKNGSIFESHPITNTQIVGFKVPMFEEIKKIVCEAASLIPEIGFIGWDVAVSVDGPVIIEGNECSGVFQLKPSLSKDKTGDLPKFKKHINI